MATATITGNLVSGAVITNFGCGYTSTPTVRIVGGGGVGATALAIMVGGIVTDVVITNSGSGYTSAPKILIESPPFEPTTSISVSRINVTQRVRVNHNYVLEESGDLITWTATGPQFTAESEEVTNEFVVGPGNRFFRVREVP